jgi:hypothetical protein
MNPDPPLNEFCHLFHYGKILYQSGYQMMIFKYDGVGTTEIPAGHALNAVFYAVDLRWITWLLCGYDYRLNFVFTRLGTDQYALATTHAAVFIPMNCECVHYLHSFNTVPW